MVAPAIANVVRAYLRRAAEEGIDIRRAVVFGSQATGKARADSDIDVVVISPQFEPPLSRKLLSRLWELRAFTDSRVEPIPCGDQEWFTDRSRTIIEIARREGVTIES